MFDILDGFVASAETTLRGVVVVAAIAFVAATWARTKSLVPTLGALLLGAVVIFGVSNFRTLARDIERDVNERRVQATIDGQGSR